MKIPSPRFSTAGSQDTSRARGALVTPISSSPSLSGDEDSKACKSDGCDYFFEPMNEDDALDGFHPGLMPGASSGR